MGLNEINRGYDPDLLSLLGPHGERGGPGLRKRPLGKLDVAKMLARTVADLLYDEITRMVPPGTPGVLKSHHSPRGTDGVMGFSQTVPTGTDSGGPQPRPRPRPRLLTRRGME